LFTDSYTSIDVPCHFLVVWRVKCAETGFFGCQIEWIMVGYCDRMTYWQKP